MLEPEVFVRIGPGEKRKLVTSDEGVRILALGGVPGRVYELLHRGGGDASSDADQAGELEPSRPYRNRSSAEGR